MCMAGLFASMKDGFPFAVAHCNFNLRGEESDMDEALVRSWAEEHDVKCHVRSFETGRYAEEHGISIEMAARDLRYSWFAELCNEYGYAAVAVAHNANDNAETLVLNLLRGTGIRGISGMSSVSSLPSSSALIFRPLLECTRKQIEGYAFANDVKYREDRTNALSDYKRNRIRNDIFPLFEKINPSYIRTLNREMGYFAQADEIVGDYCSRLVQDIVIDMPDDASATLKISLPKLLSRKHWSYLLYHILEPYGFNSAVTESLESLLESERTMSGKRFESDGYVLLTERDELVVLPKSSACGDSVQNEGISIDGAGQYDHNGLCIKVEVLPWKTGMSLKQPAGVVVMDAARLRFPFVIRKWERGDWMIPFGMRGKKKISDLFADLKYDARRKDYALMIADGRHADNRHVAGVVGVRIDDNYKITENTESIIRISITDNK